MVRLYSANANEVTRTTTLTIGSMEAAFSVTTRPVDNCDGGSVSVGTVCFDGAVFAGTSNGNRIFVASSNEGLSAWKTSDTYTPGTYSDDGWKNFQAMIQTGASEHPAAAACQAKGPDWYLPSLSEFIAVRNSMTPTQLASLFVPNSYHLTSETYGTGKGETAVSSSPGFAYAYSPTNHVDAGRQKSAANAGYVHCFRHDGSRTVQDPCETGAEVGDLCGDGTVYAGEWRGNRTFIDTNHEGLKAWKTADTFTAGTYDDDGFKNSGAIRQVSLDSHPGLATCAAKGDEWYLPGLDEFRTIAANFPAGLRVHAFPAGASQLHMTSETYGTGKAGTGASSSTMYAYAYSPSNDVTNGRQKSATNNSYVHCFKADEGRTYEDPCATSSPAIGALCADGTLYAGSSGGSDLFIDAQNETGTFQMKTARTSTLGTFSETDGIANTAAMSGAGFAAASACLAKGEGWYIPARNQLAMVWQSVATSHSFPSSLHWSSTQFTSNVGANFGQQPGGTETGLFKDALFPLRCAYESPSRTPDNFTFAQAFGLAGAEVTSAATSISGIIGAVPVSVSGDPSAQYSINGGAFTSEPGTILNGQSIVVRLTTSGTPDQTVSALVRVGTRSATFSVTTQDTVPNAFTLSGVTGSNPGTPVTSAAVIISGINVPTPISISAGAEYSVDGGSYTSGAGTILAGQTVQVRINSSSAFDGSVSAILTIGGVDNTFTVTTRSISVDPDPFTLAAITNAARNTLIVSGPVTISGLDVEAAISLSGEPSAEYSLDGGAFTSASGTVLNGQVVRVRMTSSDQKGVLRAATLQIGSVTAGFSVTTTPPEACETGAVGSVCSDGAVYAGVVNGYKIFAAPSSTASVLLKNPATVTMGSITDDGLLNHHATTLAGLSLHPAAEACAAMGPEWVLPSLPELQQMYATRNSAPAGTYTLSGSTASRLWSSTEHSADPRRGQYVEFSSGSTTNVLKTSSYKAHCIRYSREEPRTYQDPCAGTTPSIGTMCADGAVYAGEVNGRSVFLESTTSSTAAYKSALTFTTGTNSTNDPVQIRLAMNYAGLANFPAQSVCAAKGVSSYGSNWYLPSQADLELMITNRSAGVISQMTSPDARNAGEVPQRLWTATQMSDPRYAVYLDKGTSTLPSIGTSTTYQSKSTTNAVLCMRYDEPVSYADPCAGTPSTGDFCADGSVYAGDGLYLPNQGTLSSSLQLRTTTAALVGTTSTTDGMANTNAMIAAGNHPAAQACRNMGADWFLPAISQLAYLSSVRTTGEINGMYGINTSTTTIGGEYWSSTQSATTSQNQTRILASTSVYNRSKTGVEGVICLKQ